MELLQPRDRSAAQAKLLADIPKIMRRDILRLVVDAYHRVYRDVQSLPLGLRKDEFGRRLRTEISAALFLMSDRQQFRIRRRIVKVPRRSAHFVLLRHASTFLMAANTKRISGVPRSSLYMAVLNSAASPDLEDLDLRLSPLAEDLPVVIQYGHSYPTSNVPMDPTFVCLSVLETDGRSYVCSLDLIAEFEGAAERAPVLVAHRRRRSTATAEADQLPLTLVKQVRGELGQTKAASGDIDITDAPSLKVVKRKGDGRP